jgi:hypothetical protein
MFKTNPVWNTFYADALNKTHRTLTKEVGEVQWLFESAEVVDIILDNKHPLYKDDRDIGCIVIKLVNTSVETNSSKNITVAKPASPYIKKYPLKHEIVTVFKSSNTDAGEIHKSVSYYYLDVVNIWGMANHNVLPGVSYIPDPENKTQNYIQFTGNAVNPTVTEPDVGDTFQKNENVPDLQPYEGDIIFLGRWGQSIRFGSTVRMTNVANTWSSKGNNGDPIIIIQATKAVKGSFYKVEDVNSDSSSIYICDGQAIGIELPSTESNSFRLGGTKPKATKEYVGRHITISSDRLLLSAKNESIILNSKKTIWLSADNSVNIDSANNLLINSGGPIKFSSSKIFDITSNSGFNLKANTKCVFDAPQIFIGANATEMAVLGNQLLAILTELLTTITADAATPRAVSGTVTVPSTYLGQYSQILSKLQQILSKKVFIE